jgi:hypothetical protein
LTEDTLEAMQSELTHMVAEGSISVAATCDTSEFEAGYTGSGGSVGAGTQYQLAYYGTTGSSVSGLTLIGASKVLVSDANGLPIASSVTPTTLGYLDISSSLTTLLSGKQSTLTTGNLTDAGTDGITVTSGTGAVIGSGTSLSQHVADATHNGYLSSTDWSTFNGKQAAGSFLTTTLASADILVGNGSNVATAVTMSSDATLSNTGALTLATVNNNVGSFTNANSRWKRTYYCCCKRF